VARVFFPNALRRFTGGVTDVEVDARDVRGLFRALELRFPELEGRLREGVAVSIDGEIVHEPLLEPIEPRSEIHFLPSISGG
jgi:molybdopterin converting factor small subunit